MQIRFPMHPVGTNSAASFPKISAARRSKRLTVGSSPYTSSPTSASAMARRISAVGRVTVSLRVHHSLRNLSRLRHLIRIHSLIPLRHRITHIPVSPSSLRLRSALLRSAPPQLSFRAQRGICFFPYFALFSAPSASLRLHFFCLSTSSIPQTPHSKYSASPE